MSARRASESLVGAVLAAASLSAAGGACAAGWHVAERAQVRFQAHQMGVPMEGGFTRLSGRLRFDWPHPTTIGGSVIVTVRSLKLDAGDFVDTLMGGQWFAAAQHPQARFQPQNLTRTARGYVATGRLTIKGVSHEVQVPVSMQQDRNHSLTVRSDFDIRRLAYSIGSGDWSDTSVVADPVTVHVSMSLVRDTGDIASTTGNGQ